MASAVEKTVDDVILAPVEDALDAVGLMQGSAAPLMRTALGLAIGGGVVFGLQPSLFFNSDGSLRPWSMMSNDPNATPVPWWVGVAFPAVVLGVLI